MTLTVIDDVEQRASEDAPLSLPRENEEARLVPQAKAGDAAAWGKLYRRYERKIFRVASRMMRNREDAEDVVQQSFQRAFMHLDSFKGDSRLSTWLTRIAINEALMMIRRRRPNVRPLEDLASAGTDSPAAMDIEDSRPTPEQQYADSELRNSTMDSVLQLRPSLRAVVVLRELRDFSTEETAHLLGISIAAVKARMFHARNKLRKSLRAVAELRNRRIPKGAGQLGVARANQT